MVLLGVGNPVKRDDSVGLYIAEGLRKAVGPRPSPSVRIQLGIPNPDLAISRLDLKSSKLVIFDAVEAAKPAGSVVFTGLWNTDYGFFATHNLPLKLYPSVRKNSGNVSILGVQPDDLGVGEGLSATVASAADGIINEVVTQLRGA